MPTVFIDFETYFSGDYSLRNMTTREYIMDPRFEIIGMSIAVDDGETGWWWGDELELALSCIDWPNARLVCHNMQFDGAILKWRLGRSPRQYLDTLSLARAQLSRKLPGCGLADLTKHYGLVKDSGALAAQIGNSREGIRHHITDVMRVAYIDYAVSDVDNMRVIYNKLLPGYPEKELVIIDLLARMYIDGDLRLNLDALQEYSIELEDEEDELLRAAGVENASDLRSASFVAKRLEALGAPVPMTIGANGQPRVNLNKSDPDVIRLLTHEDPAVVALMEARMAAGSSIRGTRTARLLRLAQIGRGELQVPLQYSGAHTHRFSGRDRLNLQNLPRGSVLKKAILAPAGKRIVVADASQIEARLLAWLAREVQLTSAFAKGEDVYSSFAAKIFGHPVSKAEYPVERDVGKVGVLSLGYAAGAAKLLWMFQNKRVSLVDAAMSQQIVTTYRHTYSQIPKLWKAMDVLLQAMMLGHTVSLGPITTESCALVLPSGLKLYYPELRRTEEGFTFWDSKYKTRSKIYGGMLTENVIQALARIQITDTMLKVWAMHPGWFCALQVHDELAYLVPEDEAEVAYATLCRYMSERPSWADETLTLAAEGGIGVTYGECK